MNITEQVLTDQEKEMMVRMWLYDAQKHIKKGLDDDQIILALSGGIGDKANKSIAEQIVNLVRTTDKPVKPSEEPFAQLIKDILDTDYIKNFKRIRRSGPTPMEVTRMQQVAQTVVQQRTQQQQQKQNFQSTRWMVRGGVFLAVVVFGVLSAALNGQGKPENLALGLIASIALAGAMFYFGWKERQK